MPFKSEKQRRLFYVAASGKKTKAKGLSKSEAARYIAHDRGGKLPLYKRKKK